MFDRRRPCADCPFRVGMGSRFALRPARLKEIREAPAFRCHKTTVPDEDDEDRRGQGDHPQQCAGLMAVLLAEGGPNQIMQVAVRLGAWSPERLDRAAAYASWRDVLAAHLDGREPPGSCDDADQLEPSEETR